MGDKTHTHTHTHTSRPHTMYTGDNTHTLTHNHVHRHTSRSNTHTHTHFKSLGWLGSLLPSPPSSWPLTSISSFSRLAVPPSLPVCLSSFSHLFRSLSRSVWFLLFSLSESQSFPFFCITFFCFNDTFPNTSRSDTSFYFFLLLCCTNESSCTNWGERRWKDLWQILVHNICQLWGQTGRETQTVRLVGNKPSD